MCEMDFSDVVVVDTDHAQPYLSRGWFIVQTGYTPATEHTPSYFELLLGWPRANKTPVYP